MTCEQCAALLADYLDRALAPARAADVDAHVAGCPACAETLAACKALPGLLRKATDAPMPPEAMARLRRFLAKKLR